MRCDWACTSKGGVWHAFARDLNEVLGVTQLFMTVCGRGPGLHPYSGIRLAPACKRCTALTKDEGIFTVLA